MAKKITGYLLVVLIYSGFLFAAPENNIWLYVIGTALAVVIGASVGTVRLYGLLAVFLVLTLIVPIGLLYLMGLNTEIESPLLEILKRYEWEKVILPFLSAIVSYTAVYFTLQRIKGEQA